MFKIYSVDDGRNVPIEYLPAAAITPKMGLALTQTGGQLAVASGTTAPSYICMCERTEACEAGEIIPVLRVGRDIIWETTAQAAMTSINLGDKVTRSAGHRHHHQRRSRGGIQGRGRRRQHGAGPVLRHREE